MVTDGCSQDQEETTTPATPEQLAAFLDSLAPCFADERMTRACRRAARAAMKEPVGGGRPSIQRDKFDIEEAKELFRSGRARSLNAAFLLVAKKCGSDPREVRSIAERLRRKANKSSTK